MDALHRSDPRGNSDRQRGNRDGGAGVALLVVYSAGLGVPFLTIAAFTDRIAGKLRGIGRLGRRLHQAAGVVMILMGVGMITGRLSALSYWLLDVFPVLGRIS